MFSSLRPLAPSDFRAAPFEFFFKKLWFLALRQTVCCLVKLHFLADFFLVKSDFTNFLHIYFSKQTLRPVFWAAAAASTQQSAPYFTSHPARRPRSWDISPTTVYAVCCAGLRPAADPEFAGSKTLFTQLNWERCGLRTRRFLVLFISEIILFVFDTLLFSKHNNISWILDSCL